MATLYKVTLTTEERQTLGDIVSKSQHSAAKIKHANILLAVDKSDGRVKRSDADIAKQFLAITIPSHALNIVLSGKVSNPPSNVNNGSPMPSNLMFDGRKEAQLIQLACSPPPEGRCAWTLQLLADKCVELNIVEKTIETYRKEVKAWQEERNKLGGAMNWQFTSKNARIKLKKLYPHI